MRIAYYSIVLAAAGLRVSARGLIFITCREPQISGIEIAIPSPRSFLTMSRVHPIGFEPMASNTFGPCEVADPAASHLGDNHPAYESDVLFIDGRKGLRSLERLESEFPHLLEDPL